MHQVHLIISGRVQGVFYRATCQDVAHSYALNGWVKNLLTGQVEVLAQGEKENIEKLIGWCKKGPPSAKVIDIDIEWEEITQEFSFFEIR